MQGPPRSFDTVTGNIGQLIFVRVGNHIAIANDEDAVMAELHHIRHDNERTAHRINIIPRPNELYSRPDHFRRRRFDTSHHAGRFPGAD